MAKYTDPNIGITNDWALGNNYEAEGNTNLDIIRALLHGRVINYTPTPPGGPSDGDLYIVGDSATGDWSGHDQELAYYKTAAWVFVTAPPETIMLDNTSKRQLRFTGTVWSPLESLRLVETVAGLTGAVALDMTAGSTHISDGVTGNITLSLTNVPTVGFRVIRYIFVQDGTGSHTLGFPAGTIWDGGSAPTASSGANARDTYEFRAQTGLVEGFVIAQAQA